MAAPINGTALLLYSDGQVVALQKGVSITVDTDLPDATNKESAGWAQHIQGQLNAKIDFSALFSTEVTAGMGANALMDYIINRKALLLSILGFSFPIVAEVDLSSLSFDAPSEGAMSLSGSLKVKGMIYCLRGNAANLITDPDAEATDYDTMTVSGIQITSAINLGGTAFVWSNEISVTDVSTYKLAVFITKNSGELPIACIDDYGGVGIITNQVQLNEGLNLATLITTATNSTCHLRFNNTAAANWSTSPIYLFKL